MRAAGGTNSVALFPLVLFDNLAARKTQRRKHQKLICVLLLLLRMLMLHHLNQLAVKRFRIEIHIRFRFRLRFQFSLSFLGHVTAPTAAPATPTARYKTNRQCDPSIVTS